MKPESIKFVQLKELQTLKFVTQNVHLSIMLKHYMRVIRHMSVICDLTFRFLLATLVCVTYEV